MSLSVAVISLHRVMRERLSRAEARRVALTAQGLACRGRSGRSACATSRRLIDRVAQFQIDSVNVAVRAHYMPLFSRLGPYDRGLLDRAAQSPRRLFEYWAHAACLIDVSLQPLSGSDAAGGGPLNVRRSDPRTSRTWSNVCCDVGGGAAQRPADRERRGARGSNWGWNWSEVKYVLEWLFDSGAVTSPDATPPSSGCTT